MKDAFLNVAEFERLCGHELSDKKPRVESSELVDLRVDLIQEESGETVKALEDANFALMRGLSPANSTLAEIADGLADTIFVCIGTAIRLGIDLPEVWDRVCEANMKKFGPGSWVREDGKRMKPPGWQPPDVLGVIKNQRPLRDLYQDELEASIRRSAETAG